MSIFKRYHPQVNPHRELLQTIEPVPKFPQPLEIDTSDQLESFCDRCWESRIIGFDTEFVSENRYRPQLCLLQVATDDEIAIIDTLKLKDISPFWDVLTQGDHVSVVHAAREEFLFCYRAYGQRPSKLFDTQLAAAFVGFDYPAAYSNLVYQILGDHVAKGETRTDWMKRPLSKHQINYAVGDVVHLHALCRRITDMLESAKRKEWYIEEIDNWMAGLEKHDSTPQWHRVSGATRLNRRALAILDQLWHLREREAAKKNRSPKRTIPDDLMIELAKRGSANPSNFKAIRGFDNRVSKSIHPAIAEAIEAGIQVPDKSLPKKLERSNSLNLGLLGQFLTTILSVVCRKQKIAPNLVGTAQDLRQLAGWWLGMTPKHEEPELMQGWRAQIIGSVIEKALQGKLALRVDQADAKHPLTIEEL